MRQTFLFILCFCFMEQIHGQSCGMETDANGNLVDGPCLVNPCLNKSNPIASLPFCNANLPMEARLNDAINRMTLAEKISVLGTEGAHIPSLNMTGYQWWSEATHGVSHYRPGAKNETRYMTNFAFPITTAQSFNRTVWFSTGARIGREARAAMNAGNAYSTFWAPVVNMARDPRWGRNIETPGEDPYLSGEYAEQFVKGMQEAPEDKNHYQASACCKHFAGNNVEASMEGNTSWNRHTISANITMQDLVGYYLPSFQACVERGNVTGLMCSYNELNGVPTCANSWLLDTVARKEWGFTGYVTSDCDATSDIFGSHHYTATPEEAAADALNAGNDVDCGGFLSGHTMTALNENLTNVSVIDERIKNQLRVRMQLSHFDPEGPLQKISTKEICSDESLEVAQDGVRQGVVLLKNVKNALPLNKNTLKNIVVAGPQTNCSTSTSAYYGPGCPGTFPNGLSCKLGAMGGNTFAGWPCGNNYWNMVDAFAKHVPNTRTPSRSLGASTDGFPFFRTQPQQSSDEEYIEETRKLVKESNPNVTILVLGTGLGDAKEGHDFQTNTSFPDVQAKLVDQVAMESKSPIIVILLTAVPIDITYLLEHDRVDAIIHCGHPSINTFAVADTVFGVYPPAGRLVQTIYPSSFTEQLSIFDMGMRPGPSSHPRPDCVEQKPTPKNCPMGTNPGRTHMFFTGKPVLPFGFGLAYTTFKYKVMQAVSGSQNLREVRDLVSDLRQKKKYFISHARSVSHSVVSYTVEVTNTGKVASDDVVLGFMKPPNAGKNGTPLQVLFGFERIHLAAGAKTTVTLTPSLQDFTQVDSQGKRVVVGGEYTFQFGIPEVSDQGMGFATTTIVLN
eukprot:m.23868 g.23868  ORF g.23868 m.23868 type:complete len:847 (+) comp7550_c0_seq1:294-2834(+)